MNYFNLYSSYPDPTIAAAWDSQCKDAHKSAWPADILTECESELYARFAACYVELRALPRNARRSLQRRIASSSEIAASLPEYLQQGGRRLQHRMAWSLAGAALLLALGQGVATATTITVTTNDSSIISDGQCSLIEAIVNANNDAATHADCAVGSGADTIVLPANANVTLSNANAILYGNPIGLPLITSRINIEGNGAIIRRQENAPDFGLMAVSYTGDLTLESVTLSGGSSSGGGGGIFNTGTLSIKNSTISGNTAIGGGGGVDNYVGSLTIENSTISGNTSNYRGGGLSNTPSYYGGGVSGHLMITNSTISGNRADQGGGVSNFQYCHLNHCHAAALTLNRSLIAGNQAPTGPEIENAIITGPMSPTPLNSVTANNFNLFGANGNLGIIGFTPGPTDVVTSVSLAQIMGPLSNNGGPTQTHALVPGSPAVDAGDPAGCRDSSGALLTTDQRGKPRAFDGNGDTRTVCDIGAYELNAQDISSSISISDATVTEGNDGTVNVTFQVSLSAPSSQPVTVTFSTANRTAISGIDYVDTSGSLTFDPGETTKTINVMVNANDTIEFDKTFLVNLTRATNAFIGDRQAIGTIVNDDGVLPERFANVSTRGRVLTGDNVMIGGFIIDGSSPGRVLVRSRGPSMAGAPFFVPGTLANPLVRLFSGQTVIAQNDNWQDSPSCSGFLCEGAAEIMNTGLDPCTPNPGQTVSPPSCALEAAILVTLPPGAYTTIVSGADGRTGAALVEVFEADASTVSDLGNISTRGFVQSGDDVMIGGLIIEGSAPATVLIRARGPSMSGAPFFVPGTLANPFLQLFSGQTVIAQNDNWQDVPSCGGFACGGAAQITATALDPCQPNPGQSISPPGCAQESAIFITLPPGAYTAIVSGVGGGTGVGLVEVFELD